MKQENKQPNINYTRSILYTSLITACYLVCNEAYAFDLEKAAKATFDPVITAINNHYGKGLFCGGTIGMLASKGDMYARGIGFGIGVGSAGLIMLGMKAGLGV